MISGLSALMHTACWLEDQIGIELLFVGRHGFDKENSCRLEMSGKHLAYWIILDNTFVFLHVQVLDSIGEPEELLSIGDCREGWRTICKLIRALERNEVKSLARPIEAGSGPHGFVIA